jgi:hypothetical protein
MAIMSASKRTIGTLYLFAFVAFAISLPSPIQAQANQSTLTVFFVVKNGRLRIDKGRSSPVFSEVFKSRLTASPSRLDSELVKAQRLLLDDLDRVFARTTQLYWYALPDDEKARDADGALNDDLTKQIRNFSTNDWADVKTRFEAWAAANSNRFHLQQTLSALFADPALTNDLENSPFLFFPQDDETGLLNYSAEDGTARFQIGDPIHGWDSEDYHICLPLDITEHCTTGDDPPAEAKRVRAELASLSSRLWRPNAIRARIEEYYAAKGFVPTVALSGVGEDPKWINIQKSPRIGRILLPGGLNDSTLAKILYLLLPDKEFRFFVNSKTSLIQTQEVTIPSSDPNKPPQITKLTFVDFLTLGAHRKIGDEPLLNQYKLQTQQVQLSQLGFVLSQTTAGGNPERVGKSYLDLDVAKLSTEESASAEKSINAPDAAGVDTNKGFVDGREQKPQLQTALVPDTAPVSNQPNQVERPTPRERRNYLGGGFDYKPGQGVRPFVIYQRQRLGPGNLALQMGAQDEALGSLSYTADFALFGAKLLGGKFFRRLTLQLTGSSDFQAKRVFAGIKTDERRTGGLGRADLEIFRDRSGHLLRLSLEARHMTVELTGGNTTAKQNLNTLDFGGYYLFQGDELHYPRLLRLEPRLRLGLGLAAGEPSYRTFQVSGNFHQKLPRLLEADITGIFEQDSANTPLFEQASFGGPEINRGFRRDDAIGRSLWSLQNELWLPVPATRNATEGPIFFLRRSVRLAPFIDVSGVDKTTASQSGFRAAPGVGVRVIYNLAVIKIDWAYGLGDGVTARGHGRFSFSVAFNRPF